MSRSNIVLAISLFLSAGLCSCTGLGTVPASLVELYDCGSPGGMIQLELNRDGSVEAMEAEISTADLPAIARETALQRVPGGTITGGEREVRHGGTVYEVKLSHQNRGWEIIVDKDGRIVEIEKELTKDEAPAAVLAAADKAIPGGTFKSVESIESTWSPGKKELAYHVKKTRDGASYKMIIAQDGKILRKVREARAEIEIPLKN